MVGVLVVSGRMRVGWEGEVCGGIGVGVCGGVGDGV